MNPMKLLHHAEFHGANRLGDKSSRWFWVPSMLILFGSAITLVILTISRYKQNPTYMLQIEKAYRMRPFPTVILCPEINFVEEKMDDFLSKLRYPSGRNAMDVRLILNTLAAFWAPDVIYDLKDLMTIEDLLDYNGMDVETAGEQLTASCEETIIKCRWSGKMINCSKIFRMELTGDGFCCVFNGRSLRREMKERGMDIKKTEPSDNWYTARFSYISGLMLAVNQSQKLYNVDLSYKWLQRDLETFIIISKHAQLALQTSQHFVDTTINGTALNPGLEQWISYNTRGFQIAVGAKSLSPELRKCKMSSERLRYFPLYNKRYCLLEQEMAKTLDKCRCVRMVHPKPPGVERCRAQMLLCAQQAKVAYDNLNSVCLSTCDVDTDYSKTTSGFFLNKTVAPVDLFYKGLNFSRVTIVRVFIQNRKQYTNERWSYYGYLDLFSQLGGMFNVFFGCSILTLLGLLQFCWYVIKTQWQNMQRAAVK